MLSLSKNRREEKDKAEGKQGEDQDGREEGKRRRNDGYAVFMVREIKGIVA